MKIAVIGSEQGRTPEFGESNFGGRLAPESPVSIRNTGNGEHNPPEACCGEPLRPFWADDGSYMAVCMRCGGKFVYEGMVRFARTPWIGVDLDGTLARDSGNPEQIGEPHASMMRRVRNWVEHGQTVKIFTARASVPRQVLLIKKWLKQHGLPDLEVTNEKDFFMIELWDDRAIQVDRNSGQPVSNPKTLPDDSKLKIVARKRRAGSLASRLRMFFAL